MVVRGKTRRSLAQAHLFFVHLLMCWILIVLSFYNIEESIRNSLSINHIYENIVKLNFFFFFRGGNAEESEVRQHRGQRTERRTASVQRPAGLAERGHGGQRQRRTLVVPRRRPVFLQEDLCGHPGTTAPEYPWDPVNRLYDMSPRPITERTEGSEDLHETRTATRHRTSCGVSCEVFELVLSQLFVNKDWTKFYMI